MARPWPEPRSSLLFDFDPANVPGAQFQHDRPLDQVRHALETQDLQIVDRGSSVQGDDANGSSRQTAERQPHFQFRRPTAFVAPHEDVAAVFALAGDGADSALLARDSNAACSGPCTNTVS